jgi:hypothetical protein
MKERANQLTKKSQNGLLARFTAIAQAGGAKLSRRFRRFRAILFGFKEDREPLFTCKTVCTQ